MYKKFSVQIQKENENGEAAIHKIQFISRVRFMVNSLSNLADNLAEKRHKSKCKDNNSRVQKKCVMLEINKKVNKLSSLKTSKTSCLKLL